MIADNEGKIVAKLGRSEGCGEGGGVGGREILILWKEMGKKRKK